MISPGISKTTTVEVFPEQKTPTNNNKKGFICGHGPQATKDNVQELRLSQFRL